MIYQSLKRLLFLRGQAQIILHLTPSLLGGVIFYQLDCFLLGQVTFYSVHLDILQPGLEHQASIRGITSFEFGHLQFMEFLKLSGCCLQTLAEAFFIKISICFWVSKKALFNRGHLGHSGGLSPLPGSLHRSYNGSQCCKSDLPLGSDWDFLLFG